MFYRSLLKWGVLPVFVLLNVSGFAEAAIPVPGVLEAKILKTLHLEQSLTDAVQIRFLDIQIKPEKFQFAIGPKITLAF